MCAGAGSTPLSASPYRGRDGPLGRPRDSERSEGTRPSLVSVEERFATIRPEAAGKEEGERIWKAGTQVWEVGAIRDLPADYLALCESRPLPGFLCSRFQILFRPNVQIPVADGAGSGWVKPMSHRVKRVPPLEVMALRREHRKEVNAQIVHDQISEREGWTRTYRLERDGEAVGFGSVAIAGPWKDKPTLFEFFLRTEERARAFTWFEEFLQVCRATRLEVQTNEQLLTTLALAYGRNLETEAVVFRHGEDTQIPSNGVRLSLVTPGEEVQKAIEQRRGGGEWVLKLGDQVVGKGGVLCHYNPPYGDLHMEIAEPFRRRGWGSYLLQELTWECRRFGVTPVARCNVNNVASRRTLQRAGFVPCALIVAGNLGPAPQ